jgi:hypothetical protein
VGGGNCGRGVVSTHQRFRISNPLTVIAVTPLEHMSDAMLKMLADTTAAAFIAAAKEMEEEVAATEDVDPDGQGELSIIPNETDSLRYYCEYHPQTMLGDIRISNATTTTSNQTQ